MRRELALAYMLAVACAFALAVSPSALPATAHADDALPQLGHKVSSFTVDAIVMPKSTAYWLAGQDELTSVDLHGLYTANTTDMKYMFQNCSALAELDLSNLDTSSATDMTGMFEGMSTLEKVTLGEGFSFRGAGYALASGKQAVLPGGYWVNASKFKKPMYAATDASGNYLNAVTAGELAENYGISSEDRYAPGVYVKLPSYTVGYSNGTDTGVTGDLPASRMWVEGTLMPLPEIAVEREGYRALGWVELNSDGTEGSKFAAGTSTKVLRDMTLKPRWEHVDQYTVRFSKGDADGVTGTAPVDFGPVPSDTSYPLPGITFTRPGYRASGWVEVVVDEDGSRTYGTRYGLGSTMKVRREVTLEPTWGPLQVSASVPTRIPLVLKGDGGVVGPTASSGGSSIRNRGKYTSFLVTGASVTKGADLAIVEKAVLAVKEMTLEVTPRKEGSSADGTPLVLNSDASDVAVPAEAKRYEWEVAAQKSLYLGLSGKYGEVEDVTQLLDGGLDAGTVTWQLGQPDPVVVSYDANGGSGSMEAQSLTASVEFAAPPCMFAAPDGRSFGGWATSVGGAVVYRPDDTVQVAKSTTLYAKWV